MGDINDKVNGELSMVKQDLETFSLEITKNLSAQVKELEQKFAQAGQAVTSVAQELQTRAGK